MVSVVSVVSVSKTPQPKEDTRKQESRGNPLKDSAASAAARGRDFVPRSPSLELYVLPNGGGQLLYRQYYAIYRNKVALKTQRLCYPRRLAFNGAEGDRTPDLTDANGALSQLSYSPAKYSRRTETRLPKEDLQPVAPGLNVKAPLKSCGASDSLQSIPFGRQVKRNRSTAPQVTLPKALPGNTIGYWAGAGALDGGTIPFIRRYVTMFP